MTLNSDEQIKEIEAYLNDEDSESASTDDDNVDVIVSENVYYSRRDMRCLRKKLFQDMIALDGVEKATAEQIADLKEDLDKASD